jgi:hypothetical protein
MPFTYINRVLSDVVKRFGAILENFGILGGALGVQSPVCVASLLLLISSIEGAESFSTIGGCAFVMLPFRAFVGETHSRVVLPRGQSGSVSP